MFEIEITKFVNLKWTIWSLDCDVAMGNSPVCHVQKHNISVSLRQVHSTLGN